MGIKLKLRHKGWILTAVPLAVGLLFIIILFQLLQAAEHEATEQLHSKLVVADANVITTRITHAGMTLVMYKRSHDEHLFSDFDNIVRDIPSVFAEMEALSKDRPQAADHVRRLRQLCDSTLAIMAHFRKPADSQEFVLYDSLVYTHRFYEATEAFFKEANLLQNDEKEYQNQHNDETRADRIKLFLIAGIIGNFVLAAMLSSYFSTSVTQRLAALTDNNSRLAKRQPLNPPLPGDDEIAELDHGFHEMAEALEQAEKLKREFVSMISHDLKSPLTSVVGGLELVAHQKCGEIPAEALSIIERTQRNVQTVLKLLNGLLEIERLEAGAVKLQLGEFEAQALIDDAIDLVRSKADRKNILVRSPLVSGKVFGDREAIIRVLVNLLDNAIKFSPTDEEIIVEVEHSSDQCLFRVCDKGRGVPKEFAAKIFDRFQQVSASDTSELGGSVLGLAICKLIVQAHGGNIGLESEPDGGCKFSFSLPGKKSVALSGEWNSSRQTPPFRR